MNEGEAVRAALSPADLQPGDILLCRGNTEGVSLGAQVRSEIALTTDSPYTHAALYLGGGEIVDARVREGIRVHSIGDAHCGSDYIAVIRQPDVWDENRTAMLRTFANKLHALGTKYNVSAFASYVLAPALNRREIWQKRQQQHQDTVMDRIEAIFAGKNQGPPEDPYRKYFCSELVVAAFALVGYLSPSAKEIYSPAYLAPGDLIKDCTFGFLVGYMAEDALMVIPADDPLIGTPMVSSVPPWGIP